MAQQVEHESGPAPALNSKRWRYFRCVMWVMAAVTVVGIADQVRALGWLALEKAAGSSRPWSGAGWPLLFLTGYGLLAFSAYRILRQNRVPPTWVVVSVLVVAYAALGILMLRG